MDRTELFVSRTGGLNIVAEPNTTISYGRLDDDGETVACHECGLRFRSLSRHITHIHKIAIAVYRSKHGLSDEIPLCSTAVSARMSRSGRRAREWVRTHPENLKQP